MCSIYIPPHFIPTGRSSRLQRLGIVMATSGLLPELLAVFDSITAQRQLGFCQSRFTCEQHLSLTGVCTSWAAMAQGYSLKASMSGLVFLPHSPAPSTLPTTRTASSPKRKGNRTDVVSICGCVRVKCLCQEPIAIHIYTTW